MSLLLIGYPIPLFDILNCLDKKLMVRFKIRPFLLQKYALSRMLFGPQNPAGRTHKGKELCF